MSTTRQYELVYIVPGETSEDDLAALQTQVEGIVGRFSGAIDNTENWGRRRLAYQIGPHKEGVYVLVQLSASPELVKELDRRLKVSDLVIRHLIVRVDEDQKAVAQQAAAAARAARAVAGPEGEPDALVASDEPQAEV